MRRSWGADFDRYTQDNVLATQRLLEAALRAQGLQRFVYASSSSVYGNASWYPTEETDRPQPLSPRLGQAGRRAPLQPLRRELRPTDGLVALLTVYGPRQRPDMAFTRFCRAVRDEAEIQVFAARVPGPRLHVRRRRRRGEPPRGGQQGRQGRAVFNVAARRPRSTRSSSSWPRSPGGQPRCQPGALPGTSCGPAGAPRPSRRPPGGHPNVAGEGLEEQYRWVAGVLT